MSRDEIKPLSGKPYFHVVIAKSHVSPRNVMVPSGKMCQKLPYDATIPTVLNCRGKSWDMTYNGQNKFKQFDTTGWRNFVKDNNLKIGDACVFELMENSEEKIVFEVQILRGGFPGIDECEEEPIFRSKLSGTGESDSPYVIE
ncbi:B3 domain-containing protein Os04g0386900-like [Vicia villosa]|uniref:B3 domain-containing protein Os04g0386900-like n=1 Tax=Vicia villosa TaxID=3911 RepID=UPI00273C5E47|nr:B3 domain-containing protein Os04g0386900-like [Vicia villosa]